MPHSNLHMENQGLKMIDAVIDQIKEDVKNGDVTAIEEMLKGLSKRALLNYLPEQLHPELDEPTTVDDVIRQGVINFAGAEVLEDEMGQILIYTGLMEKNGELVPFECDE